MTHLATHDLDLDPDQLDLLSLVADTQTPLGSLHMTDFKVACYADACSNDGWVHPSRVSAILTRMVGEFDKRSFSAKWAPACGPDGFLDKTDVLAPIDGTVSKGNANKSVRLRRWRGFAGAR